MKDCLGSHRPTRHGSTQDYPYLNLSAGFEQDLYQEIIYQLWKSFSSFRIEAKISTWMCRIPLNTSIANSNEETRRGNPIPITELILNKSDTDDSLRNFLRMGAIYFHARAPDILQQFNKAPRKRKRFYNWQKWGAMKQISSFAGNIIWRD